MWDRSGCRVLPSTSHASALDFPASCPYIPTSTSIPAPQAAAETALQDILEQAGASTRAACAPLLPAEALVEKRRAKPLQPSPAPPSAHNDTPITLSWAGDKPSLTQAAGGKPTLSHWQPGLVLSQQRESKGCPQDRSLPSQQALITSTPLSKARVSIGDRYCQQREGNAWGVGGTGTRQAARVAAWCCALASVSCGLDVSLEEGSMAQRLSGLWELITTVWGESEWSIEVQLLLYTRGSGMEGCAAASQVYTICRSYPVCWVGRRSLSGSCLTFQGHLLSFGCWTLSLGFSSLPFFGHARRGQGVSCWPQGLSLGLRSGGRWNSLESSPWLMLPAGRRAFPPRQQLASWGSTGGFGRKHRAPRGCAAGPLRAAPWRKRRGTWWRRKPALYLRCSAVVRDTSSWSLCLEPTGKEKRVDEEELLQRTLGSWQLWHQCFWDNYKEFPVSQWQELCFE